MKKAKKNRIFHYVPSYGLSNVCDRFCSPSRNGIRYELQR